MIRTRRWTRVAATLGAVALFTAACGSDGDDGETTTDTEAPADDGDTEEPADDGAEEPADDGGEAASGDVLSSITIGINNPNYATQLPVILADERGYFEEEGITEIEIIETDDYIAGLIGGSLDITQGDTDVAFGSAEASGEEIVFTGTYRDSEYQILAVREGIESPEDLVGADLTGGALGGRNQLILEKIVQELGLDVDDVNFVPQGGNSDATLQAIISGTVDGGSLFPRHRFALEENGGQFLYEELTENPQEGVLVMGDFLEENRATVEAFWRATLRARQDIYDAVGDAEAEAEIFQTMRDRGFEIPEEFEGVFELEVDQISQDGGFDPGLMDDLVAEQVELGNLPEGIDWRQFVNLEPLHAAQEAVGLEIRPESLD